jgi:PadR family transcriptional regulator PadR
MPKNKAPEDLVRGTLDMLILRTLALGALHGYAIAKHIQRTSDDVLQVETGSLYPALRRLEQKGWIISRWEKSQQLNRELRFYRLTPAGRKQLASVESTWGRLVNAIAAVMKAEEV